MRTIPYAEVLRLSLEMGGMEYPPNVVNFPRWRGWIGGALREMWNVAQWREVTRCEMRYFRDLFDIATAYASAGMEVYYPPESKYYHTIRPSTGNLPTDVSYFAESQKAYNCAPYDNAFAYVAGQQAYYSTTDLCYQRHTPGSGNLPTDTAFWGPLVPFDRYVPTSQAGKTVLGNVFDVWDLNPRVTTKATKLDKEMSNNGVQVFTNLVKVWVEFRLRVPRLWGNDWSATLTYPVGQQAYYESLNVEGDFYDTAVLTAAGESPETTPAKWSKVEIPFDWQDVLVMGSYLRYLRAFGQSEKAAIEIGALQAEVTLELDRMFRQERGLRRIEMVQ